jgi:hypothetical protein
MESMLYCKEASMDGPQWLKELRTELQRKRLPTWYVDRFIEELADHAVDLKQEHGSMEAHQLFERLGKAEHLASAACHEFRESRFAGRHPVLTFLVGPFLIVPAVFVTLVALAFAAACAIAMMAEFCAQDAISQFSDQAKARAELWVVFGFNVYTQFLPFAIAAWLFCRWGQRSDRRKWSIVACGIVAVIAGIVMTKCSPATGTDPGTIVLGLTLRPTVRQLAQLLVPLAVACWLLLRLPQRPGSIMAMAGAAGS